MLRKLLVLSLCATLGGCGLAARKEREEAQRSAIAARDQGLLDCKAQFPDGSKQYVGRNKCESQAAATIRPHVTYPDLFDKDWAFSAVLAERLQAGKITLAEANQQLTEHHSEVAAEEQRRNLANRSIGAQENMAAAAWRASSPVSCTRIGNTTNCY